jgi:hypothetical protein
VYCGDGIISPSSDFDREGEKLQSSVDWIRELYPDPCPVTESAFTNSFIHVLATLLTSTSYLELRNMEFVCRMVMMKSKDLLAHQFSQHLSAA